MIAFIDECRSAHGVESICRIIAIAPSTYYAHVKRRAHPETAPPRVREDGALKPEIQRIYDDNFGVYGARKVWRQLKREGFDAPLCKVERLIVRAGAILGQ